MPKFGQIELKISYRWKKHTIGIFISPRNSAKITTEIKPVTLVPKINRLTMPQNKTPEGKKSFSVDWLVRGSLTRVGDIFDRLTGRGWKPSSSLATSELIERVKKLLDSEIRETDKKSKFVPHNIKLKVQWDKFSTDAEDAMKKLEYELLTAVIDHINDNRYHTYAPLKFEVKPDYFVEGVKLYASFDKFAEEETEAELNVTVPNLNPKNIVIPAVEESKIEIEKEIFIAEFAVGGKSKQIELAFQTGQRLSVGRTKENALSIEDASVSKNHASLVLNPEKQLMLADTGSTNGTFINDERIAYGKAFPVAGGDKLKFGTVGVSITRVPKEVEEEEPTEAKISVPASAVATEQMLSEKDFLTKKEIIILPETDKKTSTMTASDKENPFVTTQTSKEEIAVDESSDGKSKPTEQEINLDLGENE